MSLYFFLTNDTQESELYVKVKPKRFSRDLFNARSSLLVMKKEKKMSKGIYSIYIHSNCDILMYIKVVHLLVNIFLHIKFYNFCIYIFVTISFPFCFYGKTNHRRPSVLLHCT